jgi:hypothetical protein
MYRMIKRLELWFRFGDADWPATEVWNEQR